MINRIRKSSLFLLDYIKFNSFLRRQVGLDVVTTNKHTICVVVQPWLGTSVPWFAITMGLLLKVKGKKVLILVDDVNFGDDKLFHKFQSYLIVRTVSTLKNIEYKLLSMYKSINIDDEGLIDRLSQLNSIHHTKGETDLQKRKEYESIVSVQLREVYCKYHSFFLSESMSRIIVPGGLWGGSGVVGSLATVSKVRFSTYDSGEGLLLFSLYGVAAQLKDIPYSFEKILTSKQNVQYAIQEGKRQLEKRRSGLDMYTHFDDAVSDRVLPENYYLMLLNSVWDSAALGLHSTYDSMIDWILDSVTWVLENSEKTIIIRQHPAERASFINNTDSYGRRIQKEFGGNNRVVFIAAMEEVNTYNLIDKACCILGFSSTSIVESVALGKPAIIVSNVYYSDFGVVYKAESKRQYHEYLLSADNGDLKATQDMSDRAYVSNYLSQNCNWIQTIFTPNNNDFSKWVTRDVDELIMNNLPLESLLEDMPVSLIKHRRNMSA